MANSVSGYVPPVNISDLNKSNACQQECALAVKRIISCLSSEQQSCPEVDNISQRNSVTVTSLTEENIALSREVLNLKETIKDKDEENRLLQEKLIHQKEHNKITDSSYNNNDYKSLSSLQLENVALKNDNFGLQEKVTSLIDKVAMLKNISQEQDRQLEDCDSLIAVLQEQHKSSLIEINKFKLLSEEYKNKLEVTDSQVGELKKSVVKQKPILEVCSEESICRSKENEKDENSEEGVHELVRCYEERLYEAIREVKKKNEKLNHIETVSSSLDEMIENLKKEKMEIMFELKETRRETWEENKRLLEEKLKLEETIRQQTKLIHHLQDLLEEKKEKRHGLNILCSSPEKERRNRPKT